MSRRFSEPCGGYYNQSNYMSVGPWSAGVQGWERQTVPQEGRWPNTYCMSMPNNFASFGAPIPDQSGDTFYMGFAYYCTILANTTMVDIYSGTDSNQSFAMSLNTDGSLQARLYRNGPTVGPATDPGLITPGWNYIELAAKLVNSTAGWFKIRVNKVQVLSVPTVLTCANTAAFIPSLLVFSNSTAGVVKIQDAYWNDATGDKNNGFDGDQRMYIKRGSGVGQQTQFTPHGAANNWDCVDDTFPDADTTNIDIATTGRDLYSQTGVNASIIDIKCVDAVVVCMKDSAGTCEVAPVFGDGTNHEEVTGKGAPSSYGALRFTIPNNPLNDTPWTKADFNTSTNGGGPLQIGIERTA